MINVNARVQFRVFSRAFTKCLQLKEGENMTIGERIREVRLSQPEKTSMEKFADRLGVTKGSVSLLESGRNQPSDQTIRSICREFNINELWLREGIGDMKAQASRAEEMATAVKRLFSDRPASFQSALVTTLLRFDPDGPEWELLERIYNSVAAEKEKGPDAS